MSSMIDPAHSTPSMTEAQVNVFLFITPVLGLIWAAYNTWKVSQVKVLKPDEFDEALSGESAGLLNGDQTEEQLRDGMKNIEEISSLITHGAKAFLWAEYRYMGIFMVLFGSVIFVLIGASGNKWENAAFSTIAFVVGCLTSIVSGYIGMRIAVYTNSRTALMAWGIWGNNVDDRNKCYNDAFRIAFQGGNVMGFSLVSCGLLALYIMILIFRAALGFYDDPTYITGTTNTDRMEDNIRLFECVAAFGLGGSSIAMFGRVGGGIFTKAADVGADLVGKVVQGLPEDSPENPGVIADCIGDNVGDIAGMGSDLFGSFGEATCAALVLSAYGMNMNTHWATMMYPLMITAVGILVCIITSLMAILGIPRGVNKKEDIEPVLKYQLIISTVLATAALYPLSMTALPHSFHISALHPIDAITPGQPPVHPPTVHNWEAYLCVVSGLWCGLVIGLTTEYYTSNAHRPVQELADACETGAATNVIGGLAVGYYSTIIPIFSMALTVYLSFNMCLMYGIALAALGILSTMATGLTIDAYGPISDNAGGIVEMSELPPEVRVCTDDLDAAGNTTAAIGKGFAIASAAFVGLALYAAFVTHCELSYVNILDSRTFPGLLVGAMLPSWFSAMTMKSVNKAAMEMVREIKRQFDAGQKDHEKCVDIATRGSLNEMIAPGLLVMLSPVLCGIFFGKECLAGLLPGALSSGVQMAISMSNTGGAWDNAKKYIESGQMRLDNDGMAITVSRMKKGDATYNPDMHESYPLVKKGHEIHKAAVVGDTVGDPLKDTSGPALNILVKLMAIISVVFVPVVTNKHLGGVLFNHAFKDFITCVDGTDSCK